MNKIYPQWIFSFPYGTLLANSIRYLARVAHTIWLILELHCTITFKFVYTPMPMQQNILIRIYIYVTGFWKTDPNRTFGISRITNLKYLTHCESLLLGCSHAIFAV